MARDYMGIPGVVLFLFVILLFALIIFFNYLF